MVASVLLIRSMKSHSLKYFWKYAVIKNFESPLRYGKRAERIAVTALVARFSGLIANGPDELKNAVNLALSGQITAAELRFELERYAELLRAARMSNPLIGSDEV